MDWNMFWFVFQSIVSRRLLPRPPDCPPDIYKIMLEGWNPRPDQRFSPQAIFVRLVFASKYTPTDHVVTVEKNLPCILRVALKNKQCILLDDLKRLAVNSLSLRWVFTVLLDNVRPQKQEKLQFHLKKKYHFFFRYRGSFYKFPRERTSHRKNDQYKW